MARQAQGFSMVELVVGISLLSVVTMLVAGAFEPWMRFRQGLLTDSRLHDLQSAIEAAYRNESLRVDGTQEAALSLAGGTLANGMRATRESFASLMPYAVHGAGQLATDGFNQPYWVFVTPRLKRAFEGADINYHVAAIVSAGANGALDAGTAFDRDSGMLSLGGDDIGVVIDGFSIARAQYVDAVARLRRVADAYQAYFRTRYLSDPRRDIAVDYFSSPCGSSPEGDRWDVPGPATVSNSCGDSIPIGPAELQALGMERPDALDPFGRIIHIENSSPSVRNPDNPQAAMGLPPYTARVLTRLPGDVIVAVAVAGAF